MRMSTIAVALVAVIVGVLEGFFWCGAATGRRQKDLHSEGKK
jgi:hypothetical protein